MKVFADYWHRFSHGTEPGLPVGSGVVDLLAESVVSDHEGPTRST